MVSGNRTKEIAGSFNCQVDPSHAYRSERELGIFFLDGDRAVVNLSPDGADVVGDLLPTLPSGRTEMGHGRSAGYDRQYVREMRLRENCVTVGG